MLEEVRFGRQSNDIWAWLEAITRLAWAMLRLERDVFGANENRFETYIIAILF